MADSPRYSRKFPCFAILVRGRCRFAARLVGILAMGTILLSGPACLGGETELSELTPVRRIYIAKADGSEKSLLAKEMEDYDMQGSPDWSKNGELIAFDAWRTEKGEGFSDARIIVVDADGGDSRALIDGAMPSFTPRARRIVFSRYSPNRGVWIMDTDGPDKGLALLDESGWAATWSPDGRKIAYIKDTAQGADLVILDVVEGTRRGVFEKIKSPYSEIYWNFAWSPDSKRIVLNASRGGRNEVAIVDVRGAKHGLTTRLQENIRTSFSWRPDGKRILFCKGHPKRKGTQLFLLDPKTTAPPQLLPEQKANWRHVDTSYAPDGTKFAVSIRSSQ